MGIVPQITATVDGSSKVVRQCSFFQLTAFMNVYYMTYDIVVISLTIHATRTQQSFHLHSYHDTCLWG